MNRKKRIFLIIIISLLPAILFLGHALVCTAAQEVEPAQVTAVIMRDMRPSSFINKATGQADGFGVELMNAVAKKAGLKVSYLVVSNWKEAEDALQTGKADMCPVLSVTEARQQFISFTDNTETFGITINIRTRSRHIHGLSDLKGRKVAVIRASQAYMLLKTDREINLIEYDSFESGMFALLAGQIEAFVIPDYIAYSLIQEAGIENNIRILSPPLLEIKRAIGVRKDKPLLYEQVNKALRDFLSTREYRELYVKWFGMPKPYWTVPRVATIMGIILFIILIAMALWRHTIIVRFSRRLKESEEKFRCSFENANTGMCLVDMAGNLLLVNDKMCEIFGYSKQELEGMTVNDIAFPEDTHISPEFIEVAISGKKDKADFEKRYFHKDGHIINALVSSSLVRDVAGMPSYFISQVLDMTEHRKVEETIHKERQRFQTLVENAPFGMVIIDEAGRFTYMNHRFKDIFGYDLTDIPDGRTWFRNAYPDPEYRHAIVSEWTSNFGQGKSSTTILRIFNATCKDGSVKEVAFTSLQLPSGEFLVCCEDITQLRLSQEALRESEAKYRSIVDNSLVGFCIIQDDTFKFVNKRFCEIYGYPHEELIGKMHPLHIIHPDDKALVAESVRKRLSGEVDRLEHEFRAIRKDGQAITVKVFGTSITYNGRPATTGSVIDVTREKALESQLFQAQKMEAIGVLAGGIAHDFNNILMTILGYTSFLLIDTDVHDANYERLKVIEKQVQDGADLTKQLLGFARGGRYEVKTTDLNGLITRSVDMFGRTKREINIYKRLEEGLWTVDIDRGQIEQALLNLFVNAWQAMPEGGELYIETRNVVPDEEYLRISSLKPGKYVKISITDSGIGMDEGTKQRIFEPFFTTKEMGRGTGLGLASVYGIIKNHGGSITVYSEKGGGTTFNIYLPASEKAVIEEQKILSHVHKGVETVLLVDDQEAVLGVGKDMLEKLGYTVLPARSGEEALEVYRTNREKVALVILDMIMPGMSGGETFNELREINPDIKVILSSGYSINGQASKILDAGCKGFIQKPFSITELSKKIREALD